MKRKRISSSTHNLHYAPRTFLRLPDELILCVLSHLSVADLGRIQCVCKKLLEFSQDASLAFSINLSGDTSITKYDLLHLNNRSHQIRELYLNQIHILDTNSLNYIWNQYRFTLETFSIASCRNIEILDIKIPFSPYLRNLSLVQPEILPDVGVNQNICKNFLLALSTSCPCLQQLYCSIRLFGDISQPLGYDDEPQEITNINFENLKNLYITSSVIPEERRRFRNTISCPELFRNLLGNAFKLQTIIVCDDSLYESIFNLEIKNISIILLMSATNQFHLSFLKEADRFGVSDSSGNTVRHYLSGLGDVNRLKEFHGNTKASKTWNWNRLTVPLCRGNVSGQTPLFKVKDIETAQFLIEKGSNPYICDSLGKTCLNNAVILGNVELIDFYIQKCKLDIDQGCPLETAIATPHADEICEKLLQYGANPNKKQISNQNQEKPLLVQSIQKRKNKVTQILIQHGADVNEIYKNSPILLIAITAATHSTSIRPLLDAGANPNPTGWSPLYLAVRRQLLSPVKDLLNVGADVNWMTAERETILICACNQDNLEIVKLLLKHGANVNSANNPGWTSLHRTARRGKSEMIKLLLESNADVNLQEHTCGDTPLHIALKQQRCCIPLLLLTRNNLDINKQNKNGDTALHLASKLSNVWNLLIKHGASTEIYNNLGQKPIQEKQTNQSNHKISKRNQPIVFKLKNKKH